MQSEKIINKYISSTERVLKEIQRKDEVNITNEDVDNMDDAEVLDLIKDHIEFMIGINGVDELWLSELQAIVDFDLYEWVGLSRDEVRELYEDRDTEHYEDYED